MNITAFLLFHMTITKFKIIHVAPIRGLHCLHRRVLLQTFPDLSQEHFIAVVPV